MTFGYENYPNIISERNRYTYNLFYASLSLIFGNSIAVTYFFSVNHKVFSRRNLKVRRILNDQVFLNGGFAHWSFRLSTMFGIFSVGMMDFIYIPYMLCFGILLILVLYLDTWKALILVFDKSRYLRLLIHFLTLSLLALGLSFIHPINYKEIDRNALERNPKIDPNTEFHSSPLDKGYLPFILKLRLNDNNMLEIILEDGSRVTLEELPSIIALEKASRRVEFRTYIIAVLMADKNMPIEHILEVQNTLCHLDQYRIMYATASSDVAYARFEIRGIESISCIPYFCKDLLVVQAQPPLPISFKEEIRTSIEKDLNTSDRYAVKVGKEVTFNGLSVPDHLLAQKFKNNINPHTLFEYECSFETEYQHFIKVLSAHYQAAFELRANEQTIHYNKYKDRYNQEREAPYRNEQDSLKERYPIKIIHRFN